MAEFLSLRLKEILFLFLFFTEKNWKKKEKKKKVFTENCKFARKSIKGGGNSASKFDCQAEQMTCQKIF